MEFVQQLCEARVSCLFDPGRNVTERFLQPRPCGPTLEPILARAVRAPETRQAQAVQAVLGVLLVSPATQEVRFLRGELQAILRSPFAQHPRETLRITLGLEGADEVIGRATPQRLPCAVGLHHFCKPPIEGVMAVQIRQDGCHDSALGEAGHRVEHLAVRV